MANPPNAALPPDHVTVIGAGVVGVATAFALRREGLPVTLVDRDAPGMGCSYGNAGAVSPGSVAPIAMPGVLAQVPKYLVDRFSPVHVRLEGLHRTAPWLVRFVMSARPSRVEQISRALAQLQAPALERYRAVLKDVGAPELLQLTGQLHLYPDAAAFAKDAGVWRLRRARGVAVEDIGRREIRQLEPAVGERYGCGVYLPNEGMIRNPHRAVEAIAAAYAGSGGEILRCEVRGFENGAEGPTHLVTSDGRRPVRRVVIAAGAWSHRLVAQLGCRVPLQTQRGYHLMLPTPGVEIRRPVVAADAKCFATPMEGGLRLAGTVEIASLEAAPDFRRARALYHHGRRLLPGLSDADAREWMGHRPCLPDSLPGIGPLPNAPSVIAAFGHGHLGLTGAVVTGDLVADILCLRPPSVDLAPFSIRRFGNRPSPLPVRGN